MNDLHTPQDSIKLIAQTQSDVSVASNSASSDLDRELVEVVGSNLKKIRHEKGLSLDALAKLSNVSRAMLSQIENGRSSPTVTVLYKISNALHVTLADFISQEKPKTVTVLREYETANASNGAFFSRALFPVNDRRGIEFYEITIKSLASEKFKSLPAGTSKQILVKDGEIDVIIENKRYSLKSKDTILFAADQDHEIHNSNRQDSVFYLLLNLGENKRL